VATIASGQGVLSRARFAKIKDEPTDNLDAYEWVLQAKAFRQRLPGDGPDHPDGPQQIEAPRGSPLVGSVRERKPADCNPRMCWPGTLSLSATCRV
jgi:hypothetical protein